MDRSDMIHVMYDKKGPIVAKNFIKRGFAAYYCPTKEDALSQAVSLIPEDDVVSWGGSVSINEIGLRPYVLKHRKCIDRDTAKTPQERQSLMRQALLCDTFIMGTNAAVQDGQLFNIDGNGNRVAALIFGPKQVIAIVGMNKIEPTLEAAITRARSVAAPINIQRFNLKTPCTITGICSDCDSNETVCNQLVHTRHCSPAGRIKIILVGENLGF
ncbi:MAG: lactate utilization protein [Megasphaera sp.]|nr:lactate utilization protein [Megasphaera sp.]MCI1248715.1 lactate utilization protein [Megasphaera sp.]